MTITDKRQPGARVRLVDDRYPDMAARVGTVLRFGGHAGFALVVSFDGDICGDRVVYVSDVELLQSEPTTKPEHIGRYSVELIDLLAVVKGDASALGDLPAYVSFYSPDLETIRAHEDGPGNKHPSYSVLAFWP